MTVYAAPARLRELRRLETRIVTLDRERAAVVERQNRVILDDLAAQDASPRVELARALGINEPALRQRLKRLRERLAS